MDKKVGLSADIVKQLCREMTVQCDETLGEAQPVEGSFFYIDANKCFYLPCFSHPVPVFFSNLEKTVLFLFLLHPEGIRLVQLTEYREELYLLYSAFPARHKRGNQVVDNLIQTTSNRFYEVISSIRRKVTRIVGKEVAADFCIRKYADELYRLTAIRKPLL